MNTAAALVPQHKPVGVFLEYCLAEETTLLMRERLFKTPVEGFRIQDTEGYDVVRCRGTPFGVHDKTVWLAPDGRNLFTLIKKRVRRKFAAEKEDGDQLFVVEKKMGIGPRMVATFHNFDGEKVELRLRGEVLGRNARLFFGDEAIAYIDYNVLDVRLWATGKTSYRVTVAPGVDLALVAAICTSFDSSENE